MRKHLIALLILASLALCACTGSAPVGAPFSGKALWSWDESTLEKEMGLCDNTYPSIYGGVTYSYPQSLFGYDGTVKYMFSDTGKLASVAWTFLTDSSQALGEVREKTGAEETKRSGPSTDSSEGAGNEGSVWYLKDRDVLIYTVSVGGSYGLQYSYISREFSKRDIAQQE